MEGFASQPQPQFPGNRNGWISEEDEEDSDLESTASNTLTPKKAKKTIVGESPAFQQLINQQLEALMPEIVNHVSAQMGNGTHQEGAGTGGSGSNGCTYKEFVACKPKEYDGRGGAVTLTRWIEKMEQVMDISGCTEGQKVKYAASSLINKALTWWNTQIQARGRVAALAMTWEDFKTLMVEEFCPRNDMQKLEEELWNNNMVGANHAGYTDRFHELARMVPHMVTPESKRIDRYICGLVPQIHSMVRATEPTSLLRNQLAIEGGQGQGFNRNTAKGKAFTMNANEARQDPNVVTVLFSDVSSNRN
ncbi:reverse transcriptase domain-containing protein [Artemisia annua]|uniref:Reverse transcriptase domain-containing protein n=1 Tax=Artemisia annua TaxID=35608 RepID=A0A2U1P135_ARTAN|nr:reverse transcriptase domain-containing protein [Artemisia annua]